MKDQSRHDVSAAPGTWIEDLVVVLAMIVLSAIGIGKATVTSAPAA